MMPKNRRLEGVLIATVTLTIVAIVGVQVAGAMQASMDEDAYEDKVEWCENRNGTVVNSMVIGEHGGLHCDLPNGTLVHFHDMQLNGSEST